MSIAHNDTIAALSTAAAPAARIVIRLSGPASHTIADLICSRDACVASAGQSTRASLLRAGSATQQFLHFNGLIFPAWIYAFRAPASYTGDDLIEFHIPGNPVLAKLLLDELFARGARSAEPGEFTARAYFNGKLDLTEAEGVAATIAAGNESELRAARQLMAGELARRLAPIMDGIAQTLALIEVGIDFSEEEVTFLAADQVHRHIGIAEDSLDQLTEESNRFETLTHEPTIVLAGRPNAGKSSLINALTGQDRAVISNVAGTTRDVLSAPLDLPRGRVMLLDIAGIEAEPSSTETTADAQSLIDQQMQFRARSSIDSADHLVLVQDSTDTRPAIALHRLPDLVIRTKADLQQTDSQLQVSSHTRSGLDELRLALDRLAFGSTAGNSALALNRRHVACIADAQAALARADEKVHDDAPELVAAELREALDHLGNILGSVTPDDVLGRVFSAFCIGK